MAVVVNVVVKRCG